MWIRLIASALALLFSASPVLADQEAPNTTHVVSGPHGGCYAKSVPAHARDPEGEPRQQGRTSVYRVADGADELIHEYDWFGQTLHVLCGQPEETIVVRLGPWHRGHDPEAGHLAVAFYKGGEPVRSYSTLDIAGADAAGSGLDHPNVSASVSHYTVFRGLPKMVREVEAEGVVFREFWVLEARTVDGRVLRFDPATGELL